MFLHPLGLLALLSVPVVVGLHLFRRRFRPTIVSALFLWIDDDETLMAGRRRERLRTNASFWLEVLAALTLGLAFAGPAGCGSGRAEHLVCVLDASASMGATPLGGSTRDAALEVLRDRIDSLSPRSRVTLIVSGTRPELLAGPAAFPAEAAAALDGYRPTAARHDLEPAVALGLEFASGGALVVITDHFQPDAFPAEVELLAVGAAAANVAITSATRTPTPEGDVDRILVTVAAKTSAPVERTLTIVADGSTLERTEVRLDADQRRHFAFEVPATTGTVEVRLPDDALAIDDGVFLAPTPPRTLAIASTLEPETSRVLGLSSGTLPSPIDRVLELVPHSVEAPSPLVAHVVLSDTVLGGPNTWCLSLETHAPGVADTGEREDLIAPFLAEHEHRLLEGTTLDGIVWSAATDHALVGTPLVSAGNRPLLTEQSDGRRTVFRLNIDPFRSSLQLSPDWPILLANLAEMRRLELPGPVRTNIAIGEPFEYRGVEPATYTVRRVDADGAALEVPARNAVVVEGIEEPGLYALERDGDELCRFGVSFKDPSESDLRGAGAGERAATTALSDTSGSMGPLEIALLFLAVAALLADWWVLSGMRRRAPRELAREVGS